MFKTHLIDENSCDIDRLFAKIKQLNGHGRLSGGVCGIEKMSEFVATMWDIIDHMNVESAIRIGKTLDKYAIASHKYMIPWPFVDQWARRMLLSVHLHRRRHIRQGRVRTTDRCAIYFGYTSRPRNLGRNTQNKANCTSLSR